MTQKYYCTIVFCITESRATFEFSTDFPRVTGLDHWVILQKDKIVFSGLCEDNHADCPVWDQNGECDIWTMAQHCPFSCQYCGKCTNTLIKSTERTTAVEQFPCTPFFQAMRLGMGNVGLLQTFTLRDLHWQSAQRLVVFSLHLKTTNKKLASANKFLIAGVNATNFPFWVHCQGGIRSRKLHLFF